MSSAQVMIPSAQQSTSGSMRRAGARNANVLIVDSGMKNLGGHNFSYTRAVQSALEARGYGVKVYANRLLPGDLARSFSYEPIFTCGAYDFPKGHGGWRDLQYVRAQAVIHADELESALTRLDLEAIGLIFCHTVGEFELLAWRKLLDRIRVPGHVMIVLRNTLGYRTASPLKRMLHPYWRLRPAALNAIHRKIDGRFVTLTDSDALTEDYQAVCRSRVVTLPIPIPAAVTLDQTTANDDGVLRRYGLKRERTLTFGYMGDSRASKGFPMLPALAMRVLEAPGVDVRFVIQCPPSASGPDGVGGDPAVTELRALADRFGSRVVLIPEKLDERDYGALLRFLDVVLLPYQKKGYVEPTSGIFAEALAAAKPVVVTRGTWMARELAKSGSGVEFDSDDIESLTAQTLHLAGHYDAYAEKARQFEERWRAFHNAGALVELLLTESGLPLSVNPSIDIR